MCSAHLGENFQRLSQAIRAADLPAADPAHTILERGWLSLRYSEGSAAGLQEHEDALLDIVRTATPDGTVIRDDDQVYLVSYLLDGVALGDLSHFETFANRFPVVIVDALKRTASPHLPGAPDRSH
jgi:hypothetical protein